MFTQCTIRPLLWPSDELHHAAYDTHPQGQGWFFQTWADSPHSSLGHSSETTVLDQKGSGNFKVEKGGNSAVLLLTLDMSGDDPLLGSKTIRDWGNFDPPTVREAGGFERRPNVEDFCFLSGIVSQDHARRGHAEDAHLVNNYYYW